MIQAIINYLLELFVAQQAGLLRGKRTLGMIALARNLYVPLSCLSAGLAAVLFTRRNNAKARYVRAFLLFFGCH